MIIQVNFDDRSISFNTDYGLFLTFPFFDHRTYDTEDFKHIVRLK